MARKRMLSPEIWESENFGSLSILAKILYIGMISQADDEGLGRSSASFLKARILPYDELRLADVDKALSEIGHKMSVTLYEVEGNKYYALRHWKKWQKIDKPRPSTLPQPPLSGEGEVIPTCVTFDEDSRTIRRTFDEDSAPNRIEQEENKNRTGTNMAAVSDVVTLYNSICKSYNRCEALCPDWESEIVELLKHYSIETFKTVFEKVENNKFLKGENPRRWKATFDWLINEKHFVKILNGNYDNEQKAASNNNGYVSRNYSSSELSRMLIDAEDFDNIEI